MVPRLFRFAVVATVLAILATARPVNAERVRYHYVPNAYGTSTLKPCGPNGAAGEVIAWLGRTRKPINVVPHVNTQLTFRQPYTGQSITVPVYLPHWVPRVAYTRHWVTYEYSNFAVEIHFLPDGAVDVEYVTGLLRRF